MREARDGRDHGDQRHAGVGKTALAIRLAHRMASAFPDGQLYASLRGHAAIGPADPLAVLARFLRDLGIAPERTPAERATARPHQTLAALAAQLAPAGDRDWLDVLAADDDPATSVRTVFSWSYQALPAGTARMFRLLGVHPGPDVATPAAAALAATGAAEAQRLLESLAVAHLLEEATTGRYRLMPPSRTAFSRRPASWSAISGPLGRPLSSMAP